MSPPKYLLRFNSDKLDEESEYEKDDKEANLALMATTTSNAEPESFSNDDDDDDVVFSKLVHEELVSAIKELVGCCINKSKNLKVLNMQYDLMVEESKKLSI